MDRKTFKKKLVKNRVSKIISFVLAAATVLFLILGLTKLQGNKEDAINLAENPEQFKAYAYLDIIAYDEWACKYGEDTYYVLFDNTGDIYMAVLADKTVRQMARKEAGVQEYTHYFNEEYRLYGTVKLTSRNVASLVEEAYSLEKGEYRDYFGSYYFDTKEIPGSDDAWMWLTFALFTGIFTLVFGIVWIGSEMPFNRETRDYTEEEFAKAAQMLDENDKKQQVIFGEKFLISRGVGMLTRYEDILWIHLVKTSYNGVHMGTTVGVNTRKRNMFKIAPKVKDSEEELNEIMAAIVEKNPEVLIGYTPENKNTYKTLTKE